MNKALFEKVNGILLLDKSLDVTSNRILQQVKRIFLAKKAGHTGSLDPLATGMLPICFGEATKVSQFLLDSDKYYLVTAKLGVRTNTADAEGEILETFPIPSLSVEMLESILRNFIGNIEQTPPMFSAIKYQGQPLYKLARKGIEVERNTRRITIHSIQLNNLSSDSFELSVHCTKGTYIRTLIDDIGMKLGCGAYVSELRRTAVAPYLHAQMYTLEELEKIRNESGLAALRSCLLPLDSSLPSLPNLKLTTAATFYIRQGQPVMAPKMQVSGLVKLFSDDDEFIGLGEMLEDGRITPKRLLAAS